jgi:hypothetical protein
LTIAPPRRAAMLAWVPRAMDDAEDVDLENLSQRLVVHGESRLGGMTR